MNRRNLLSIGSVLLALVATVPAGVDAAERPLYSSRLRLPILGDGFSRPRAVVTDLHADELFVCDTGNHRIAIFGSDGLFRFEIPGGQVFQSPLDLAVDPEGYIFLLASHRGKREIMRLDFDGAFIDLVRLSGLPEQSVAPSINSIALSPAGDRLYALDDANMRLWIAGRDGVALASADLAAELSSKEAWEQILGRVDAYGDTVLVAVPTTGRIRLFDSDGADRGAVGLKGTTPCQSGFPVAAALDRMGRVVILDHQRAVIMFWDPEGNRCLNEYFGFGNTPGALYRPSDLALDGAGRIIVSQGFENRVQVYAGAQPAAMPEPAGPAPGQPPDPGGTNRAD